MKWLTNIIISKENTQWSTLRLILTNFGHLAIGGHIIGMKSYHWNIDACNIVDCIGQEYREMFYISILGLFSDPKKNPTQDQLLTIFNDLNFNMLNLQVLEGKKQIASKLLKIVEDSLQFQITIRYFTKTDVEIWFRRLIDDYPGLKLMLLNEEFLRNVFYSTNITDQNLKVKIGQIIGKFNNLSTKEDYNLILTNCQMLKIVPRFMVMPPVLVLLEHSLLDYESYDN